MDKRLYNLTQHEQLYLTLDRLRLLARSENGVIPAERLQRLLEYELVGLAHVMAGHFAFEEEGGYLSEVLEERPDFVCQVAKLQKQHVALTAMIDELILATRRQPDEEGVKAAALRCVDTIQEHEELEVSLLQQSLADDMGVAD